MTFEQILDNMDTRIEYLGGIDVIRPYIPYSIKTLKSKFAEDPTLNNIDDNVWRTAAGFGTKSKSESSQLAEPDEGLVRLCKSKGITQISIADTIAILKATAVKIAQLPENADLPMSRYTVTIAIDGRISVDVNARNADDAKKIAHEAFFDCDVGDVECIDYHAVHAEDEYGNMTDF